MVNEANALALADLIERQPHVLSAAPSGFNMEAYRHPCNTPSCIAGWASFLSGNRDENYFSPIRTDYKVAKEWLDLTVDQAATLFLPANIVDDLLKITPSQAVTTLRRLAKTGEVVWEISHVD